METLEEALAQYFRDVGIVGADIQSVGDAQRKLPLFLSKLYDVRTVNLFNSSFVLLLANHDNGPTPAAALKHGNIVRDSLEKQIIFVLPHLKSFDRRRWVEYGISFIVPGKYFYCPMHLVDFRESSRRQVRVGIEESDALSASTQALLLAYLQNRPPCSNLADWAGYLHYARMTVSRARRELEAHQLCTVDRNGKSMTLDFPDDRKALWIQALPLLRDPVVGKKEVKILAPSDMRLLRAGISALSDLTMLADDAVPTYAMSSAAYKAALEAGNIAKATASGEADATIEKWRYAPAVLAPEGNVVDRLSLYLSLRNSLDVRVQGELADMMEGVQW